MKSPNQNWGLMDVIIFLAGLVLVLIAAFVPVPVVKSVLEAVGTSSIGASMVSYLIRRFYTETNPRQLEIVAERRGEFAAEFQHLKKPAKTVDIVGISLTGALTDYATDEQLLRRVLFERVNVRLLFVSPHSPYVVQRAQEDGVAPEQLRQILIESVQMVSRIHTRLMAMYDGAMRGKTLDRGRIGSFEIRLLELCPHATIYRVDEAIYWGVYSATTRGHESALLRVQPQNGSMFSQLAGHFDALWGASSAAWLLRFYVDIAPSLNGGLATRYLTQGGDSSAAGAS
jgi:hypothetical protein